MRPDGERWELAGPDGTERWWREDGRFVAVEVGAKRLVLAERPFDADQLEPRRGACAHPGPWPNAFAFCPECGTALEPPVRTDPDRDWSFGSWRNGWPVAGRALRPRADSRREEAVPAAAALHFVVSGAPSHLWAFDERSGWLRARREADGTWVELRRLRPAGMARRNWAAAAVGRDGFVLPTENGPVLVRAAPDAILAVTEADGIGACVGGAAALDGGAVVPVRTTDGFALAVLGSGERWRLVAPVGAEELAGDGAGAGFAAPVTHDHDAFWCGADGLLCASAGGGGVEAAFRRWDPGMAPVLGTRPILSPDGRLFQLMRGGTDALLFAELALPGRSGERRPVSSLWLSGGNGAFSGHRRRRLPWDPDEGWGRGRADYPLRDGEFVLPVLAFDDRRVLLAACPGRDALGRFLDGGAGGGSGGGAAGHATEPRSCTLGFSAATRTLEPLQGGVDAREPADLSGFVFRDRVFVYTAASNRCWSWALAAEAG